jgi:PPE-repeat protein
MNFAALPPEVNSGLMYTGPGAGPMLAAATAWDGLAADLHAAASGYESVISGLTSAAWLGPASASMAAAITPYMTWLSTTAVQAEETATQAKAAAAAYEAAFSLMVPPPVIAANRAQLMTLVATNVFGQNTPAIAAAEAHYGEMWAQDATAMYGYAGAASTAAGVTPFTPPPQTTDPAGSAGQSAAVAQATSSQLSSAMPNALQGLASPAQAMSAAPPVQPVPIEFPFELADLAGLGLGLDAVGGTGLALSGGAWMAGEEGTEAILAAESHLATVQMEILDHIDYPQPPPLPPMLSANANSVGTAAPAVSAGMGQAVSAGGLSVPPSWAAAAPEIRTAGYALPTSSSGAAPAASAGGAGSAISQMALAGMAGRALAGVVGSSAGRRESVEEPPRAAAKPPPPPQQSSASSVSEIAAGIRELGELRDAGLLTEEEFSEQKRRLLNQ